MCCVVLCWFDPAIVAPRLAWLVGAVALVGRDRNVGCGMAISWMRSLHIQVQTRLQILFYFISITHILFQQLFFLDIPFIPGELSAPSHPLRGRRSTCFSPVSLRHRASNWLCSPVFLEVRLLGLALGDDSCVFGQIRHCKGL